MVIPIKIQKILMYIPFTNFLIMIFWLINYVEMKDRKTTVFMKSLLIMFAGGIPISIVFMILSRNFADNEILVRVFNTASSYLSSFFVAFGLVKYQEKVFGLKKTKSLPENRDICYLGERIMRISIKTQKIFMFIPLANVLVLIFWMINYDGIKTEKSGLFMKSLLIAVAAGIPVPLFFAALSMIFSNYNDLVMAFGLAATYLMPFSIAFWLIRFQKKVFGLKVEGSSNQKD